MQPGKSERLHPTGNAPPSHHSSVTLNLVPVSVPLSQFRPSALAGPVRRTWVRVLTPEPSRVKSGTADGSRMSLARPGCLSRAPNSAKEAESAEMAKGGRFRFGRVLRVGKGGKIRLQCPTGISRSVGYSPISFILLSCLETSISFLL